MVNSARGGSDVASDSPTTFDYLSILARAKTAQENGREVAVDVSEIRRYEDQPRTYFDPDELESLAKSIDAGGQTTSGIIREHPGETQYQLIDGERRWRAISSIPADRRPLYKAKLIAADEDVIQFLISGIANFNRAGHTAIETMETIKRLIGFGFPMGEIAALLGISENWAYQIHGLTKLVPKVLELLDPRLPRRKQIPVTAAIAISKMEGRLQLGVATRVIDRTISLAGLRGEVVRVAKEAGTPVRMREVDPRKKSESAGNKVALILRTAEDLAELLKKPDLKKHLRSRPGEVSSLTHQLSQARTKIFDAEGILKKLS